jgi:hypothetical protein
MRFINKRNYLLFLILLLFSKSNSQTISPYALNMSGGYSSNMEWSIGESVSIANFISAGYSLNTGLLQPITSSSTPTAVPEYGPQVFGNLITVGPNPTSKLLRIKAIFKEVGSLSFQLIDSRSAIILTQEAGTIFNSYEKDLFLEDLPTGAYYLKVYFKPSSGKAKTGIYKIIKL